MQGRIGTERGNAAIGARGSQNSSAGWAAWHRIEWRAGQGVRQGGGHGKGAEHGEGQIKWQSTADRRTHKKCETERRAWARAGRKAGAHGRTGQDRTGQDRTGEGREGK